ncbi:Uncharacterised protein [Mycobacteroides abscessus subsp. abscessus]|nr:Uncharacterised protein [Mycobacteroides abscessus subsp. abscessus]
MLRGVADDRPAHGVLPVQHIGLIQVAHGDPGALGDPPGIRFQAPAQQGQQRGLAIPVAPDDADAVALVDPHGHALEDRPRGEADVQGLSTQ